jgi:hypothetical protein
MNREQIEAWLTLEGCTLCTDDGQLFFYCLAYGIEWARYAKHALQDDTWDDHGRPSRQYDLDLTWDAVPDDLLGQLYDTLVKHKEAS